MSAWRRRAIECLPELTTEFENADTIYGVFMEILPATIEAHKANDNEKLQKIYAFAEWCMSQKHKDFWNAAGVVFYEHLGDYIETRRDIAKWVKPHVYKDIKDLLGLRLNENIMKEIDESFKRF